MAEQFDAQVVLVDAGEQDPRSGKLWADKRSLNLELLPKKNCFSPRMDINGDFFRLIKHPSYLNLFNIVFLKENGIPLEKEDGKFNEALGFCALVHSAVPSGRSCGFGQPLGGNRTVDLRRRTAA